MQIHIKFCWCQRVVKVQKGTETPVKVIKRKKNWKHRQWLRKFSVLIDFSKLHHMQIFNNYSWQATVSSHTTETPPISSLKILHVFIDKLYAKMAHGVFIQILAHCVIASVCIWVCSVFWERIPNILTKCCSTIVGEDDSTLVVWEAVDGDTVWVEGRRAFGSEGRHVIQIFPTLKLKNTTQDSKKDKRQECLIHKYAIPYMVLKIMHDYKIMHFDFVKSKCLPWCWYSASDNFGCMADF